MQVSVPQPALPRPTTPTQFALPEIPIERLSFELLRPGTWDIDDVIRHYRAQARNRPELFSGRLIDYGRLEAVKKLRPVKYYIGNELWDGVSLNSTEPDTLYSNAPSKATQHTCCQATGVQRAGVRGVTWDNFLRAMPGRTASR